MNAFLFSLLIFFSVFSGAAGSGINDSFVQRRPLASQEDAEDFFSGKVQLSYEPFEPLAYTDALPDDRVQEGSLWWEWIAPRDGWFTAGAVMTGPGFGTASVFTGDRLENLLPVQNGNLIGLNHLGETIFEARQGRSYKIAVRVTGMPVVQDSLTGQGGRLRVRPSPAPPSNETLAKRKVLAGSLPLTVKTSNLTGPGYEDYLLMRMELLTVETAAHYLFGPTQWWEWTCPESGDYEIRCPGLKEPAVFVAARKRLPGGETAEAGYWDIEGLAAGGPRFHAAAGRVYDLAIQSNRGWDVANTNGFGEYTLELKRVPVTAQASNTRREDAALMPATLPSEVVFEWLGESGGDGLEPVSLWWKFTAPVKGIYAINTGGVTATVHYQAGRRWIATRVPLLVAGESVWIRYLFFGSHPLTLRPRVEFIGIPPEANDDVSQAADLGKSTDFHLFGDGSGATLEAGEPLFFAPVPPPGSQPGTLWWKWTAPGDGWLRVLDNPPLRLPLDVFAGTHFGSTHAPLDSVLHVQEGKSYLIQAAFTNAVAADVCAMHLDFIPEVTNTTWQTARDLGTTAHPKWNPPTREPQVEIQSRQWFKWTAAVTGTYAFFTGSTQGMVYLDPVAQQLAPWDENSETYFLETGKTYWLESSVGATGDWFDLRSEPLTANAEPSSAISLPADIPAASTSVFRGDRNSELEIERMRTLVWEGDLRTWRVPVIWWKWQPARDQKVRVYAEHLNENGWALGVFTGETPEAEEPVEYAWHDAASYFNARAGTTYWFAVAGPMFGSTRLSTVRLSLMPVEMVSPPNDRFSASQTISSIQWKARAMSIVVHYGAPNYGNPLRWEWTKATAEPAEPALHLIDDDDGNFIEQTATSWFNWTAPARGIYQFRITTLRDGPRAVRQVRGGSDPFTPRDLTADLFTGTDLANLKAVTTYEPERGRYLFRAEKGMRYTIRVASGEFQKFYEFYFLEPSLGDIYDFAALEESRLADLGKGWDSDAGDGIANIRKLIFGIDPALPVESVSDIRRQDRLPRLVPGPAGTLEMRCRPNLDLLPEGDIGALLLPAEVSLDLIHWEPVIPGLLPAGEVGVRLPDDSSSRRFLRWDVVPRWEEFSPPIDVD